MEKTHGISTKTLLIGAAILIIAVLSTLLLTASSSEALAQVSHAIIFLVGVSGLVAWSKLKEDQPTGNK
ncbi:MAG: hypothetical protein ACI93R_002210 [Flavobacteriales bacterium]|jgi:hypothetical protein